MRRQTRYRLSRQRGFVISVELILIFAILCLGSIVGVIAVRDAVIRAVEKRRAAQLTVKDSSTPDALLFGRPVNYDLCEAPQILCPDFGFDENNNGAMATPGSTEGLRALVGIRPDRFVTRNQIYFTGDNCTGTAYIAPPPIPDSTNFLPTLPVGYFNCGIQVDSGTPAVPVCYGVGPPVGWGVPGCAVVTDLPCSTGGRLYRSRGTTTSMPAITSRWVSLNPDCAELASGEGAADSELVTNGSFELPGLSDGAFSRSDTGPPPPFPLGWTVGPVIAGHWNPPVANFTPNPSFGGNNVPDGVQTSYVFSAGVGPEFTQVVSALGGGPTCTLSVWIGRRVTFPAAGIGIYSVILADSTAIPLATIVGSIIITSPEWAQFSTTFAPGGTPPYTLTLDASGSGPVSFDAVSLTCVGAVVGSSTDICDDSFDTTTLDLLPAVEVTDMAGANVLSPYAPLFNVMAPEAPSFGTVPAADETGTAPATGPLVPATPEES